jgi:hypothetical protein
MYTLIELETIFRGCKSLDEIGSALHALLWVKADGDVSPNQERYIREISLGRLREI